MRHGNEMPHRDSPKPKSVAHLPLEDAVLAILAGSSSKTLSAPEIAQGITGSDNANEDWHTLLMPIRKAAVTLAQSGRLIIYRKGKPADPNDFRGVYRLGLPRHD